MKQTITALSLLFLTLFLSGCGAGEAKPLAAEGPRDSTPVPVEVSFPARADIVANYEATANLASDGDAPAVSKVAGEVVELLVVEGQRVKQGQVLARLDGERLRLAMLVAKANLEKARGEYRRYIDLHERGLVSKSMFEGLKYDLDELNAAYELEKLNYEYSNIRAPIAGYVASRNIMLGQNLDVNQEAFRITETRDLVAYLQIPQTELAKFATGQRASLTVDSIPGSHFVAHIIRISPTIDTRNGTFRATASIDNSDGALAPGMFARFDVAYEKHADALTIPVEALIEEDELSSVYIVKDGQVERRTIETGIHSNGRVEVLAGMLEDEQVVIIGQAALKDGSKVLARLENPSRSAG
ncbi:MAG TPA: efflux RND transporter periplasmic adaptor subunit [Woeseiaceae bacterium]|nr:efflux RND transporter periplasmic adaptor subunit [Woeseiaceae bacterium]